MDRLAGMEFGEQRPIARQLRAMLLDQSCVGQGAAVFSGLVVDQPYRIVELATRIREELDREVGA